MEWILTTIYDFFQRHNITDKSDEFGSRQFAQDAITRGAWSFSFATTEDITVVFFSSAY